MDCRLCEHAAGAGGLCARYFGLYGEVVRNSARFQDRRVSFYVDMI
jgi:hypothetical protein